MADPERLTKQLELIEARHQKLFNMVLELTGASLEMATAMRRSSDDEMRKHGEEAWQSVGRSITVLEELQALEYPDGR